MSVTAVALAPLSQSPAPPSVAPVDSLPKDTVTLGGRPANVLPFVKRDEEGPLTREAREDQAEQADALQAALIREAMKIERERHREKIRALWAALETERLRIWEEVMLARQKVMDDLFEKWCKLLLG
ncbi:MAG: hypothetical protein FJX76_04530 [Armatimonadetes bacterium]|nr:hypothetical protein [Armatimonadota bacterium]